MTMLPGKYYLGDPCYALSDERYAQLLDLIGCNDTARAILHGSVLEGEFNLPDGPRLVVFNTLWGDGIYAGSDGREYMVDAGCIAAIPWELVDPVKMATNGLENWEPTNMSLVSGPWYATSDCNRSTGDGTLTFGHVRIDTGDSNEEEDED
jgi:hypothetical protein